MSGDSKQPTTGNAPSPFRWHFVYYALAAFDVLTVSISLYQNHRLAGTYSNMVHRSQDWSHQLQRLSDLGDRTMAVNAPGNNVFDTMNIDGESSQLGIAVAAFAQSMTEVRETIGQALPDAGAQQVREQLASVESNVLAMAAETDQIFQFLRVGDAQQAAAHMAVMDRHLAQANKTLSQLRTIVTRVQDDYFSQQQLLWQVYAGSSS